MLVYTIRRTLYSIPILFGVALITFLLFHVAGGDPVLQLLGKHATVEEIAQIRREYGLDQPLFFQFLMYLKEIVTFDFGRSFQTRQAIGTMLADGAWVSFSLMMPAFVMSELLAIAISLLAAAYRGRLIDRVVVVFSVVGMSVSFLAYILGGQYFLAFKMGLFPISGYEPGFLTQIPYLVLPWIIFVAVAVGPDVRFFRTIFLEEINQDYVRTAQAKGVGTFRLLFVHVLRNALIPIITRVVIEIPFLVLGSFLLENFFGIPGLGDMLISALNNSDWPVIKAVTIMITLLYIFGNLVSDLLYAKADPKVRLA